MPRPDLPCPQPLMFILVVMLLNFSTTSLKQLHLKTIACISTLQFVPVALAFVLYVRSAPRKIGREQSFGHSFCPLFTRTLHSESIVLPKITSITKCHRDAFCSSKQLGFFMCRLLPLTVAQQYTEKYIFSCLLSVSSTYT